MFEKISNGQAAQIMKTASHSLRALSEKNQGLEQQNHELLRKLAHYEKKDRAEKIASRMEEKGLESGLSFQEKVDSLMGHDNLPAVEEAVRMSTPNMKIASVHDDQPGAFESGDLSQAESNFLNGLSD